MTEKPVLNAASLLELKAELLRKKEAFKEASLKRGLYNDFSATKLKKIEKEAKVKKQRKTEPVSEVNVEEEQALQRSRTMLERKAALYEKLSSGVIIPDEEQSERFLVNFDKKVSEMPVDVKPVSLDSAKEVSGNGPDTPRSGKMATVYSNFVPAKDLPPTMEDEMPENEASADSGPVHYQNVQFKEVRNHGVGYFSFSMDEEERKKQLDALNTLRQHTEEQQKTLLKKKKKREALLKARLAKVRLRRNIPSKDSDDDEDSEKDSEEKDSEEEGDILKAELESVADESVPAEEPKPARVRPWDKGKDFSDLLPERKTAHLGIAKQWLESKRAERVADFAPPQTYISSLRKNRQNPGFSAAPRHEAQGGVDCASDNDVRTEQAARLISDQILAIRQQF